MWIGIAVRIAPRVFGGSAHYPVLRYGGTPEQIYAQFRFTQVLAVADINPDFALDAQDALLMYQVYLPALQGAGLAEDEQDRARAWQRQGRAAGVATSTAMDESTHTML